MRYIVALLIIVAPLCIHAQQYRYVRIITTQMGIKEKDKAVFLMPDSQDSSKYYTDLRINDIMDAVQFMEKKGYELVSITPAVFNGVIITTAYMRRRKS